MNPGPIQVACTHTKQNETQLTEQVNQLVDLLGGMSHMVSAGDTVLLKPNWVAPFDSAVTDWALIVAVAELVRSVGATPFLAESSGFEFDTRATFQALGLAEKAAEQHLELVNLDDSDYVSVKTPLAALEIARLALDADAIINLPRLKRHTLTVMTAAQKNLFGLVSRSCRRSLHARDLAGGIVAVNMAVQPALNILDAREFLTRAVYGRSKYLGALMASRDALALDHRAASLLGHDPVTIGYIRRALQVRPASAHYGLVGDCPSLQFQAEGHAGWAYRSVFRLIYCADHVFSRIFPMASIVPHVHYWFGVRPHVVKSACNACGDCVPVCPVDAIHIDQVATISAKQCMRLRCLRCIDACPENAIETRGMRRPR